MSDDKVYKDGDIVWVKLGNNWWPGEVTGSHRHPDGLIKHLKRIPYCVVKFFNEDAFEYVRSAKQIFPFQCAKKEEFLRKGYFLFNSGNSFMEKFPKDVDVAERLTLRKESSLVINDRPDSIVKAVLGQPLICTSIDGSEHREKRRSGDSVTTIINITSNRNASSTPAPVKLTAPIPIFTPTRATTTSTASLTSSTPINKIKNDTKSVGDTNKTLSPNNNTNYQCNLCDFTSVRQNVMILHRKMHSNRNMGTPAAKTTTVATTTKAATTTGGTTTAIATNQQQEQKK